MGKASEEMNAPSRAYLCKQSKLKNRPRYFIYKDDRWKVNIGHPEWSRICRERGLYGKSKLKSPKGCLNQSEVIKKYGSSVLYWMKKIGFISEGGIDGRIYYHEKTISMADEYRKKQKKINPATILAEKYNCSESKIYQRAKEIFPEIRPSDLTESEWDMVDGHILRPRKKSDINDIRVIDGIEMITVSRAARESGYGAGIIRINIKNGNIQNTKIGRYNFIPRQDIPKIKTREEYDRDYIKERISLIHEMVKSKNGKWISGEYINGESRAIFECELGHQFETRIEFMMNNRWCRKCASIKNKEVARQGVIRAAHIKRIKKQVDYIISYQRHFDDINKQIKKIKREIFAKRRKRERKLQSRIQSQLRYYMVRKSDWNRERKTFKKYLSLLPYTPKELSEHIESQFKNGMSWSRIDEIHIDHITPVSWFRLFDRGGGLDVEVFLKCWSLDNLQPLWAEDNMRKSNHYAG